MAGSAAKPPAPGADRSTAARGGAPPRHRLGARLVALHAAKVAGGAVAADDGHLATRQERRGVPEARGGERRPRAPGRGGGVVDLDRREGSERSVLAAGDEELAA